MGDNNNNAPVAPNATYNADRSSIEIKNLLRKLDPAQGNHKDRTRRLTKFRNYVQGDGKGSVEYYDDDIPLLFLGSATPAMYLDDEEDNSGLYGLLQACGTPSGDHDGTLKRSARHAMNVLKWLLLDWQEGGGGGGGKSGSKDAKKKKNAKGGKDKLNQFAESFLSFEVQYYHHMGLNVHVAGDERGGAQEDACQIVVLILTKHLSTDGESPQPVMLDEVIRHPKAQQEFEIWLARNTSTAVQDVIKKNADARQAELALQRRQDALIGGGHHKSSGDIDDSDHDAGGGRGPHDGDFEDETEDDDEEEEDDFADDGDVMRAFRKRQKDAAKDLKKAERQGLTSTMRVAAVRWEDSQLAREAKARAALETAAKTGQTQHTQTVRENKEALAEAQEREEEKARLYSKDPLGIVEKDDFDLLAFENGQAEQMEQALHDFQQEVQKVDASGELSEDVRKRVAAQKDSLEALVDRLGGIEVMENANMRKYSILPTDPKFDPMLFLTLLHRMRNYDELIGSLGRLSSKTENQVEQLQNLVRENFPLFVRCAEGFEEFRVSESDVGVGVNERIDGLEGIAESAQFQAQKAFSPLLDNTSEVRKTQSAMSVLQRVAPILQVPALMRQHIENKRYSQALKTYRRVLVVDKTCRIELLNHVKYQAEESVSLARVALERRIAEDKVSVDELLDGIRDLGELLELDVTPQKSKDAGDTDGDSDSRRNREEEGLYQIGLVDVINIREHPPALACLLLQAAHFSAGVKSLVSTDDNTCQRIFSGESLTDIPSAADAKGEQKTEGASDGKSANKGNQWKYDILDARVLATIKAVGMVSRWLPRLIRVGKAAREEEKRRAARIGTRRSRTSQQDKHLTSQEVLITNITPHVFKLVEHAAFCALGSNTRKGAKDVVMTFGQSAPDKLRALLRSPLPPTQSTKVARELAQLVEVLSAAEGGAQSLRPDSENGNAFPISPLDESIIASRSAVITIEKRRCIYAFDVCARACSNRATGSGRFDIGALLNCLQTLSEQLSRPEECSNEVEKGCGLVVRRCCEGLASYVRDRGDSARLSAVAECAVILAERIDEVVREAAFLTPNAEAVHDLLMEDISGLENALFDEYLESIRQSVSSSVRLGWLDADYEGSAADGDASIPPSFPPYLSASLLAIVRCRAQVEQALGSQVRRSEDVSYQHLAMATVADGVVEGVCTEVMQRKLNLKVRQADRLANEMEFLKTTLKKFLGEEALSQLNTTLNIVSQKAGRGRDYQRDGPDGLAALEELERLGRVYVLCLGE